MDSNIIINMILDNMKKFFYPEEWLEIDMKISKSELFALFIVDRYGEATMSQLADGINVSMSTATGIIDRLVKKEYLFRERSESDRRIVLIKLTERGHNSLKAVKDTINHYLNIIYDLLSDEEIRLLGNIIVKVTDALNDNRPAEGVQTEKEIIKQIEIE